MNGLMEEPVVKNRLEGARAVAEARRLRLSDPCALCLDALFSSSSVFGCLREPPPRRKDSDGSAPAALIFLICRCAARSRWSG